VLGIKRPVNPGKHELRVIAPGFRTVKRTFAAVEGQSATIDVDMEAEPGADTPEPMAPAPAPPPPDNASGSTWRKVGYASLGVGAAGFVVGGIAGGLFLAKRAELERDCPASHCAPELEQNVARYRQLGAISTVGFVVGAVGAATGAVLLLSAPRANREVGRGPAIEWAAYVQLDRAGVRGVF
jgi:hypothetical protein